MANTISIPTEEISGIRYNPGYPKRKKGIAEMIANIWENIP
jgi:hypothetical protein